MQIKTTDVVAVLAVAAVVYMAARAAGQMWDGVIGGVSDAADRLLYGPADAAQNYADYLADMRSSNSLNPFIWNPHNVNPVDLIPAGYRVNQWGGLERISSGGASGSW